MAGTMGGFEVVGGVLESEWLVRIYVAPLLPRIIPIICPFRRQYLQSPPIN